MPKLNDMILQANELKNQAVQIYSNEDSSAEDFEKAERMINDAKTLVNKYEQLSDLETKIGTPNVEKVKQTETGNLRNSTDYSSFGDYREFLSAVASAGKTGKIDERLRYFDDDKSTAYQVKELAEDDGSTGGFLVPEEFQTTLLAQVQERSIIRPRATVIPMSRQVVKVPVLDQTGTASGTPHWFGGIQFYWEQEGNEMTESSPDFREIELHVNRLIGYTRAGDDLVADSALSLDAFMRSELGFAGGASWIEDNTFINGDGVGKPLGILNSGATLTASRATSSQVNYADVTEMLTKFLPSGRGVWLASQTVLDQLLNMAAPSGNPSLLWGSAMDGVPNSLLGYPIIFDEKLPALGSKGDIMLVDLAYYLVGDRQATTIESTRFDRWRFNQTSWKMVHRVDGQPWLSTYFTYSDGSTQVSPFVALAA